MKILFLTPLFPPHLAGATDWRAEEVISQLRQRGHVFRVLTSNHGLQGEQRDQEIERRLWLDGVLDRPARSRFDPLKELETHNHAVLAECLEEFQPELVCVWSLHGLSKSFTFALVNSRRPVAYHVADDWLASGIRTDAWLRFWNEPYPSFATRTQRALLESTGQRARLDTTAPTRLAKGFDRVPALYGTPDELAAVEPSSIGAFRFDRLFFRSHALKERAVRAGFRVGHGEVIYPGIATGQFIGEVKAASAPLKKLLLVAPLTEDSGVLTALAALRIARDSGAAVTLSLLGRGESEFVAHVRSFAVTQQVPIELLPIGHLERDRALAYRAHDALLYTSEWDEPLATAPLEAMATGLPVIAANAGGLREVLRPGENCLGYAAGRATELAARILELQGDGARRQQLAAAGQSEVMEQFNQSAEIDRIEQFFTETVESRRQD